MIADPSLHDWFAAISSMGQDPLERLPDDRVPRVDQQLVRQGLAHPAAAPIQRAALGQEADQRRLRRLPEHGQVVDHQHAQEEEGVQRRAHPGETKVWQYITLMRRIYLIDCPGIVPVSAHDSETGTVLKAWCASRTSRRPPSTSRRCCRASSPSTSAHVQPGEVGQLGGLPGPDRQAHGQAAQGWRAGSGDGGQDGAQRLDQGKIPFFVAPAMPEDSSKARARLRLLSRKLRLSRPARE